jgi:hypothetical protein
MNNNRIASLLVLLALAVIAARSDYRFQIGWAGITFEKNAPIAVTQN